jgi:hypothetical protein
MITKTNDLRHFSMRWKGQFKMLVWGEETALHIRGVE